MTAVQVQWRRGTAAQHAAFTGAAYEVTIDTTNWRPVLHDGTTVGGRPIATEAYVQAQIGSVAAGYATGLTLWLLFR